MLWIVWNKASIFTGVFIVAASYAECNVFYVVTFFTISIAFQGVPGVTINVLDLSPNYSAVMMGISGAFTSITGIIVPYLVAAVTPNVNNHYSVIIDTFNEVFDFVSQSLLNEWRVVFWITFVSQIMKLVVFSIFGSGEIQSWDSYAKNIDRNKSDFSFVSDILTGSGYEEDDENESEESRDNDSKRLL